MKLVLNASPIIFLAKTELIRILPELTETVVIPEAVISEIIQHKDEASAWIDKNQHHFRKNVGVIPSFINSWDLGPGETEVISYAYLNKGFVAALDDKAARNCAMSLQINVIGTIGLILKARRANLIQDVKPFLNLLLDSGFRINIDLIEYALKLSKDR